MRGVVLRLRGGGDAAEEGEGGGAHGGERVAELACRRCACALPSVLRARCSVAGCKAFDGLCDRFQCVEKVDCHLRCCQRCNAMLCSTHRDSVIWWECKSCPIELCPSCEEADREEGNSEIRECEVCGHEFCSDCTGGCRWHFDGTPYDGTLCNDCEVPSTDEEMAELAVMNRDALNSIMHDMEQSEEGEEDDEHGEESDGEQSDEGEESEEGDEGENDQEEAWAQNDVPAGEAEWASADVVNCRNADTL